MIQQIDERHLAANMEAGAAACRSLRIEASRSVPCSIAGVLLLVLFLVLFLGMMLASSVRSTVRRGSRVAGAGLLVLTADAGPMPMGFVAKLFFTAFSGIDPLFFLAPVCIGLGVSFVAVFCELVRVRARWRRQRRLSPKSRAIPREHPRDR